MNAGRWAGAASTTSGGGGASSVEPLSSAGASSSRGWVLHLDVPARGGLALVRPERHGLDVGRGLRRLGGRLGLRLGRPHRGRGGRAPRQDALHHDDVFLAGHAQPEDVAVTELGALAVERVVVDVHRARGAGVVHRDLAPLDHHAGVVGAHPRQVEVERRPGSRADGERAVFRQRALGAGELASQDGQGRCLRLGHRAL